MRIVPTRRIQLLAGMLVAAGCTGKPQDTGAVDTGPAGEPEPYTISDGLPASSGQWQGELEYSRVHPYSWSSGPLLGVERLSSAASFFTDATWGVFDVQAEEGCWTDAWTEGWSARTDIGESLPVTVGAETATHTATDVSDGVLYTWRGDTPAQEWAIAPGASLGMDATDTTVIVPEPLVFPDLGTSWSDYDAAEDGVLTLEWEPPTMGTTWIQIWRREEAGGYTRCHVRDDGAVTIQFGSRRDRNDPRVFISRVSSADVELPTFGRVSVMAEDQVLLDPG